MNPSGLQGLGKHIIEPLTQLPHPEVLLFQFYLSGLDPGHIQNIIDQGQQMVRKLLCLFQIGSGRILRLHLTLGQGQHTGNTVQRSTDLMGHPGQESGLGLTGFLRRLQTPLIGLQLPVTLCILPENQKIVSTVRTPLHRKLEPLSFQRLQFPAQAALSVPVLISVPNAFFHIGTFYEPDKLRHILLKPVQCDAQQTLQIARRVDRHPIGDAHYQADLLFPFRAPLQINALCSLYPRASLLRFLFLS